MKPNMKFSGRALFFVTRFFAMIMPAIVVVGFSAGYAPRALADKFPEGPQLQVTPGSFCDHADQVRYPERVAVCQRNVKHELKQDIIAEYDKQFGYSIRSMDRQKFKIDHLIPLCAGGGNSRENLWPQHESIYNITDPLEPLICGKMAAGKLLQAKAAEIIIYAKTHLDQVPTVMKELEAL